MVRPSLIILRLIGVVLTSFVLISTIQAQYVHPEALGKETLPERLDQWLTHDLNRSADEQAPGNFRLNLASKAWFCRKERELEEWSGVPVRFRLGDQPTVDRLEGK